MKETLNTKKIIKKIRENKKRIKKLGVKKSYEYAIKLG